MHATEALGCHERVLHAPGLVLGHGFHADEHDKQEDAEGVAVHLRGVVLPEDDLRRNKAWRAHHAPAVGLLAEIQNHAKFHQLDDLHGQGCE